MIKVSPNVILGALFTAGKPGIWEELKIEYDVRWVTTGTDTYYLFEDDAKYLEFKLKYL